MTQAVAYAPGALLGQPVIYTSATPLMGYINIYNAEAEPLAPVLRVAALGQLGTTSHIEKDPADLSNNEVIITCHPGETFFDNTTTRVLRDPGEFLLLAIAAVDGVAKWKVIGGNGGSSGGGLSTTDLDGGNASSGADSFLDGGNASSTYNISFVIDGGTVYGENLNQDTTGNAGTATKLRTARAINGVNFDGTEPITVVDATAEKTVNKNVANGYAGLDGGGKVAAAQLPSYVDDALDYANLAAFPATGSTGIIYIADDTNKTYRWNAGSSTYFEISPSPGSTDSVAEGVTNLYYTDARADARVAPATHAASSKATPVDADEFPLVDSTAGNILKRNPFSGLKAAIASYYDSLTTTMTGKTLTAPTLTTPVLGTPASGNLGNCSNLPLTGLASTAALNDFAPSDYGYIAWNFDPVQAYAAGPLLTAGQVYLLLLPIRQATTITNVIFQISNAGVTLTSGQCFAGLFNSSGVLLSATADQATNWQTAGLKIMALSTPQAVAPGLYYVAFFANGTTTPKIYCDAASLEAVGQSVALPGPRSVLDTTHTGRTTSFFSPATLSGNLTTYWVAVS